MAARADLFSFSFLAVMETVSTVQVRLLVQLDTQSA